MWILLLSVYVAYSFLSSFNTTSKFESRGLVFPLYREARILKDDDDAIANINNQQYSDAANTRKTRKIEMELFDLI